MNMSNDCILCKATTVKTVFDVNMCHIIRCTNCKLVQVSNPPSRDEIAKIYSSDYFDKGKYCDDFAANMETNRRLNLLKSLRLKSDAKILDYGCATGDFVKSLSGMYEAWGCDISESAINIARKNNPSLANRFFLINEATLFLKKFDVIVLWDVLEHLSDPLSAMQVIVNMLKPNGALIISTPNIATVTAKLMKSRWAFMTPPEHLAFFSPKSLDYLFHMIGVTRCSLKNKGKWVNFAFLLYKLKRKFPKILPAKLLSFIQRSALKKICIYVPTCDIMYASAKLNRNDMSFSHD